MSRQPLCLLCVTDRSKLCDMSLAADGTRSESEDMPFVPPSYTPTRSSMIPMPDVIRRLFALFPLRVWPAAQAVSDREVVKMPKDKAELYVIPARATEKNSWASADPICLRWQMEFVFRQVPVHCEPIYHAYWSPDHSVPFALFRSSSKQSGEDLPDTLLLSESNLLRYMDHHYPLARPELDEKSVWPEGAEDEVPIWKNLLERRVMAGVLLSCIRSGVYTPPPSSKPFLRRWFAPLFPGESSPDEIAFARLACISSAGASPASLAAVYGRDYLADAKNPLTLVPGYSVDWVGFLSGTSSHTASDGAEDAGFVPSQLRVDQDAIRRDAAEGLEAVAVRLASDVNVSTGEGWLLGAKRATSLDCLLFAILHTLDTLPLDEVRMLRNVMDRHSCLGAYYRRLHSYLP